MVEEVLESEQKQKALAQDIIGENMKAEREAFLFSKEGGGEEIREVHPKYRAQSGRPADTQ